MITKIYSGAKAKVGFVFSNGNSISVIWGAMTYSDNNDQVWHPTGLEPLFESEVEPRLIESTTIEVMVFGNEKFIQWFDKKYDGNPGAYIPVNELQTIIKKADSKIYQSKDQKETN